MATALQIQQLYVAYFGRPADPAGLDYWVSTGISTKDFAAAMYAQPEFQQANANLPIIDQVNALYLNLFGRSGDTEGLLYWTQQINTGKLTLASIANDLIFAANNNPSAQSKLDKTALDNKTATAIAYTGDVRETSASLIAYNAASTNPWVTGPQFTSAVNYLAGVTQTAPTAAATQASVDLMTAIGTAGQTFTLTTNVETVPATGVMPAASTVNGTLVNGAANGQTFQTGDVINANNTSDVNINVLGNVANTVEINNARSVNFRNLSGADLTADANGTNAILWNNVGTFSSTNSTNGQVGLLNGALATTYAVVNPLIDSGAGINVTYRAADITGATNTANFSVTGVGSASGDVAAPSPLVINNNSTGATATGVETAAVATSGTNNVNLNFGTNTSRVNITGAGANTLTMQAGGIVATSQFYDLSGATGANTLDVAATLATGSTVTGGTGADTLRVTPSGLAITNLAVSGVETLRLRNSTVNGTLGFTSAPGFGTIRLDANAAADNSAIIATLLNGLSSTQALSYRGAGTAATAGAQQAFNAVTATGATTGSADTLNVAFGNGGVALTNGIPYIMGVLTANGVENIAVTIADTAAASVSQLSTGNGFASNTLTSFTASGTGAAGISLTGTPTTGGGALTTINISGLTGTARSVIDTAADSLAAASVVTASAGGTGLVALAETATDVLTFNGGAGVDIINDDGLTAGATSLFTGFVNFSGGAGADEIFLTNSAGVVANGGDDADVLVGSNAIDTLRGDAGADAIIGQNGADVLTGGSGADDFIMTNVVGGGGVVAVDNITDFTVGDVDQIGNYSATNLELTAQLDNLVYASNMAIDVAGADLIASVTNITAAYDLGTAGTGSIISVSSDTAFTAATLATALEVGGTRALTFNGPATIGDGFLVVYDNNVNSYVAMVTTAAVINDNATAAAGNLTVTNLATLSGVANAGTIATANWLSYLV